MFKISQRCITVCFQLKLLALCLWVHSAHAVDNTDWIFEYDGTSANTLGLWHMNADEVGAADGQIALKGKKKYATVVENGKFDSGLSNTGGTTNDRAQVNNSVALFPTDADPSLSVEAWVKFDALNIGSRQYIVDKANKENDKNGFALYLEQDTTTLVWNVGDGAANIQTSSLVSINAGQWYHIAGTWDSADDTARLYLDGVEIASTLSAGSAILNSAKVIAFGNRCRKQWRAFGGIIDEVRISDVAYVFTIATNPLPPVWDIDPIVRNAVSGELFSSSIQVGSEVVDPNIGDVLTFSKISGPDWLSVATDGSLSGTPDLANQGLNVFTLQAEDGTGLTADVQLNIDVTRASGYNMWTSEYDGSSESTLGLWHFNADEVGGAAGQLAFKLKKDTAELTENGYFGSGYLNAVGTSKDRVNVNNSEGLFPEGADPDLSVEIWVKVDAVNHDKAQYIIDKQSAELDVSGFSLFVKENSANLVWSIGDGINNISVESVTQIVAGQWYHIAGTWDSATDTSKLFINGSEDASVVSSGSVIANSTVKLSVGNKTAKPWRRIGGVMDELRVSSRAYDFIPFEVSNAPVWSANPLVKSNGTIDNTYVDSIVIDTDVSDVDAGDSLSFSKVEGPAWLMVATDGTLGGVPALADVGLNSFTLTAVDSYFNTASVELQITVNANEPPVWLTNPLLKANVTEGSAYAANIIAGLDISDPEGDVIQFSKLSGPAWLVVASNGALSGTPAASDVGVNAFTIEADDGYGNAVSVQLNIEVEAQNLAPMWLIDPIIKTDAEVGESYADSISLADEVYDSEGDSLTISKVSGPAWLSVESDGALSGDPAVDDAGLNLFVINVSDGVNPAVTVDLEINVTATDYTVWQVENFIPEEITSGTADPTADPDGDGKNNEYEYLFKMDPNNPINPREPKVVLVDDAGSDYVGIEFTREISGSVTYTYQISQDLQNWTDAVVGVDVEVFGTPVDNGDNTETCVIKSINSMSGSSKIFIRINASE